MFSDTLHEFGSRFWFCLALTVPIGLFSADTQDVLSDYFDGAARPYLLLLWSSVVFVYGGGLFGFGMLRELRRRQPSRQTVYVLVSTLLYLYTVGQFVNGLQQTAPCWVLALLIDGLLLISYLEMKWWGRHSPTLSL